MAQRGVVGGLRIRPADARDHGLDRHCGHHLPAGSPPPAPDLEEYANYAFTVLLAVLCVRAALRGVVLRPAGVTVVGFFRTRRVPWQDIAEVELALRTAGSSSGRWRIALRLHDGTARWIPSFLHGSMNRGSEEIPPPGDRTRYGKVFHQAPAYAPANSPAFTTDCAAPGTVAHALVQESEHAELRISAQPICVADVQSASCMRAAAV
ncbi:PH domain-containing protein [Streptomyces sp. 8N114]|uniref:PH domain-containing protein n=1 Tax=Streptomyces sp. 8N114 TaxID=3457419 RepID=UPI003FD3B961